MTMLNMVEKLEENVAGVIEFLTRTPERLKELSVQLSNIDKEIVDYNHFIELEDFNEEIAANVTFNLKELYLSRRAIKDEMYHLKMTFDRFSSAIGGVKKAKELQVNVKKSVDEASNRKYRPRINEDLFAK